MTFIATEIEEMTAPLYDELSYDDGPEIRLIVLEDMDEATDMVACQLKKVKFTPELEYRALSYCWGDPSNPPSVICNGTRVDVTVSLDSALRCLLRKGKAADLPKVFWIDAICINQQDNMEKAKQVMLMGDIYRQAQEVIVWLGPATADSDLAFEVCRKLWAREYYKNSETEPKKERKKWGPDIEAVNHMFFDGSQKFDPRGAQQFVTELDAVQGILTRPWWSRVWIIQEVALAKQVTVFCGDAILDWAILDIGMTACLDRPWMEDFLSIAAMRHATSLFEARRAALFGHGGAISLQDSLFNLLDRFRWSMATNPRDKVYGLLGLANVGPEPLVTDVNYSSTVESCCRTATLDIIKSTGTLDVLQLCRKPPGLQEQFEQSMLKLPSWIPDFSLDTSKIDQSIQLECLASFGLQSKPGIEEIISTTPRLQPQLFRASNGTKQHTLKLPSPDVLVVQGLVFDTIEEVGDMLPGYEASRNPDAAQQFNWFRKDGVEKKSFSNYLKTAKSGLSSVPRMQAQTGSEKLVLTNWKRMALAKGKEYPTGEPVEQVFISVLHQGRLVAENDEGQMAKHTAEWKRVLGRMDAVDGGLLKSFAKDNKFRQSVAGLVYNASTVLKSSEMYLGGFATYHCFAVVGLGYFALVPPETRKGDSIVLLQGGPVPFVVRQAVPGDDESGWLLIGACYVHGIMYGEQWKEEQCQPFRLV
jgi:hypothetical protein